MNSTTTQAASQVERISLVQSLNGEWLKLPLAIMQDVGPAVQTMGALLGITNRETYVTTKKIARQARLPATTAKKHIASLHARDWILNRGRQRTARGFLRRTATVAITKKARDNVLPYGILPWWACCRTRGHGRLAWSAKAVLSVVMARLCALKSAIERDGPHEPEDIPGIIDNWGGLEDRFEFSLEFLTRQTGLTRDSVVAAKKRLHCLGIVCWQGDRGTVTDSLVPNWDFRVIVTPASSGLVWIEFDRGSKSGA